MTPTWKRPGRLLPIILMAWAKWEVSAQDTLQRPDGSEQALAPPASQITHPAQPGATATPQVSLQTAASPVLPTMQSADGTIRTWDRAALARLRNPFAGEPVEKRGLLEWLSRRPSPQYPGPPPAAASPGAVPPPVGPGFGGGPGSVAEAFPMIGDRGPLFLRQNLRFPPIPTPLPPGVPRPGNNPATLTGRSVAAIVPAIRGFKIADNQYPRPVDRVWVSFNYYDGVNSGLNGELGAPIKNMQAYNETFGFEKGISRNPREAPAFPNITPTARWATPLSP